MANDKTDFAQAIRDAAAAGEDIAQAVETAAAQLNPEDALPITVRLHGPEERYRKKYNDALIFESERVEIEGKGTFFVSIGASKEKLDCHHLHHLLEHCAGFDEGLPAPTHHVMEWGEDGNSLIIHAKDEMNMHEARRTASKWIQDHMPRDARTEEIRGKQSVRAEDALFVERSSIEDWFPKALSEKYGYSDAEKAACTEAWAQYAQTVADCEIPVPADSPVAGSHHVIPEYETSQTPGESKLAQYKKAKKTLEQAQESVPFRSPDAVLTQAEEILSRVRESVSPDRSILDAFKGFSYDSKFENLERFAQDTTGEIKRRGFRLRGIGQPLSNAGDIIGAATILSGDNDFSIQGVIISGSDVEALTSDAFPAQLDLACQITERMQRIVPPGMERDLELGTTIIPQILVDGTEMRLRFSGGPETVEGMEYQTYISYGDYLSQHVATELESLGITPEQITVATLPSPTMDRNEYFKGWQGIEITIPRTIDNPDLPPLDTLSERQDWIIERLAEHAQQREQNHDARQQERAGAVAQLQEHRAELADILQNREQLQTGADTGLFPAELLPQLRMLARPGQIEIGEDGTVQTLAERITLTGDEELDSLIREALETGVTQRTLNDFSQAMIEAEEREAAAGRARESLTYLAGVADSVIALFNNHGLEAVPHDLEPFVDFETGVLAVTAEDFAGLSGDVGPERITELLEVMELLIEGGPAAQTVVELAEAHGVEHGAPEPPLGLELFDARDMEALRQTGRTAAA